jgi:hypothetical protein
MIAGQDENLNPGIQLVNPMVNMALPNLPIILIGCPLKQIED